MVVLKICCGQLLLGKPEKETTPDLSGPAAAVSTAESARYI